MTSLRSKYRKIAAQVSKIIDDVKTDVAKNYGENSSIQLPSNDFTPSVSLDINEEKNLASNIDYCQASFDKFSPSLSDESSNVVVEALTAGSTSFNETFINVNYESMKDDYNFAGLELDECCDWVYCYFDSDEENENDICKISNEEVNESISMMTLLNGLNC